MPDSTKGERISGTDSLQAETIELEDELRIHVKLNDREIGDPLDFTANTLLMDELDCVLHKNDIGRVSGCESGMGFETIFCSGKDARSMYRKVAPHLSCLPFGSYVEIVSGSTIDRAYPTEQMPSDR